ncbi:hypothetical protein OEZ86_001585 [Tetradesmus obliquus]|nr:hypothetical protein OEZ86_001585 [Tetradesmus obliquus]
MQPTQPGPGPSWQANQHGYPPQGADGKQHGFDGKGWQQQPAPQQQQQQFAQQPPYGYAGYQQPPQAAPYPPQGGYGYQQQAPPAAAAMAPPGRTSSGNGANLGGSYVVNVDPDTATSMQFAEVAVRNGFVRKVFGIVAIQLLVTVGFACVCLFVPEVKLYVRTNRWPFWTAWGLAIGLILVLACVEKARRVFPMNMMLLGAFTMVQAFLVGMISAFYNIEAVLLAFLVTAVAVGCITIFAINTKIDVTRWGTLLLVGLVAFVVLLLVGMFWVNRIMYLVIAGFACLLFSAYLLYDIQLVMGGRYYSISPDEYIFAALNIYLDIINLFLWILTLIGLAGGSNN